MNEKAMAGTPQTGTAQTGTPQTGTPQTGPGAAPVRTGDAVLPGGSRARLLTAADAQRMFDGLAAPAPEELHGVYRGRLAAIPGLDALGSGRLGAVASAILTRLRFPWYGKSFYGSEGANVWFTSTGRFSRFGYGLDYRADELAMSYDRPDNPRLVRGLTAQVRHLAPGRYLCRAQVRGTVVLYFTLEA